MKHRASLVAVLVFLFTTPRLMAGCGSSSCPLDLNALNLPSAHRFALDLSVQYIDQDQPRAGTQNVDVGAVPAHHDEVRTINRITTAALTWAASDRLHLTATLPFVSRSHHHMGSNHGHARGGVASEHNVIPQSWDIRGIGDVSLVARAAVTNRFWVIGGLSLPTGANDLRNDAGELGELPIQPGSGTTDAIAGLSWQSGIVRHSGVENALGDFARIPYFLSATYRYRTGSGDRLGNELQLNAGTGIPLTSNFEALAQVNARVRERDHLAPEEAELSGGRAVFASPGLRYSYRGSALYAMAQIPVYQRVNAIQLTSEVNYMIGVQTRF